MLLHFTREFTTLKSILKSSSFKLGYCTEYFRREGMTISNSAHPMVCFSEYEDDELESKKVTYGGYAVRLRKEWAKVKGLNPVLYIEENSQVAIGVSALLKARQKHGKDKIPKNLRLPIMQVKCFIKHETGFNEFLKDDEFCFKKENEWRYVPTKKEIGGHYISLNKSTFIKNKEKYNNKLKPYPLKFSVDDIIAIYVQTEKQELELNNQFPFLVGKVKLARWE